MQQLIYKLVKNDKRTLHVQHNLHATLNIIPDNISYCTRNGIFLEQTIDLGLYASEFYLTSETTLKIHRKWPIQLLFITKLHNLRSI